MRKRRRRTRKNPDTSSLLLLGGLAVGGYYLYTKSQAPKKVVGPVVAAPVNPVTGLLGGLINTVTTTVTDLLNKGVSLAGGCTAADDQFAKSLVGKSYGGTTNDNKVIAGGGCYVLTQKGQCLDLQGKPQPASKCSGLNAAMASQLEGMGSLSSCGLGSLGNC